MIKKIFENKFIQAVIFLIAFLICSYAISLVPGELYDDWRIYRHAAQNVLRGETPYFENTGYFNPPWVAILLIPFSLVPFRIGAGMLSTTTISIVISICLKYKFSKIKVILIAVSPIVFYIIIHSQIDALVLAGIFLPVSWWPLVAISKPQIAIALGAHALNKATIKSSIIILTVVLGVSFMIFGFWPSHSMNNSPEILNAPWNMWHDIWPLYFPIGLTFVLLGIQQNKVDWLIVASPFLFPYAAYSSFLGIWIILHKKINNWQTVILWAASWISYLIWDPGICRNCDSIF
jgi:hypothetical protein